jgi:hypothetical protein
MEPTLKQELSSEVNHHHNFPILLHPYPNKGSLLSQIFLNNNLVLKLRQDTR